MSNELPTDETINEEAMSAPIGEATRGRINGARHQLLGLHKTLLDLERAVYEDQYGRIESGKLLQLVIGHPHFAWLRAISEIIVRLDEMLDNDDEPLTEAGALQWLAEVRGLLSSTTGESEFAMRYREALQRSPDVVLAHAAILQTLASTD